VTLKNWLAKWMKRIARGEKTVRTGSVALNRTRRATLRIETLEDRCLLSVYPLTGSSPVVNAFVASTQGLNRPGEMAFDAHGNLYVPNQLTDPPNVLANTISKVSPAGIVTTFVDTTHGLNSPIAVAFDASGNLYVANSNGHSISKVTPGGVVSTFVNFDFGANVNGIEGDPYGLAFDAHGNLYVSFYAGANGDSIAKVTPGGAASIFVDNTHGLDAPWGLAFDARGNLYVANYYSSTISKVTPAGVVSTFVSSTQGLDIPRGLAFDGSGNLYVANRGDDKILKVTPGGAVSTFFSDPGPPTGLCFDGRGNLFVSNDDNTIYKANAPPTLTTFVNSTDPKGMAFDSSGNLYVANRTANTISEVSPAGVVTTFVTSNQGLNEPIAVAFDANGNLYVANSTSISKVTPGGVVSTFVNFNYGANPWGLAIDASGNLYVSFYGGGFIAKVTPDGTPSIFVDRTQGLDLPRGLAIDAGGNLYVANGSGNTISKVTPAGVVSTFVSSTEGLNGPLGLAFDASGNLYIANAGSGGSGMIAKVTPAGILSTFLGPYSLMDVYPFDLCFDSRGNLFVSNIYNTIDEVTFNVAPVAPPPEISALFGNNETTIVGTAFGTLLEAQVTDAAGNPLPGYSVTFTVNNAVGGAGATFGGSTVVTITTNAEGLAIAPVLTAGTVAGRFSVTAAVTGASTTFLLSNISGTPAKIVVAGGNGQSTRVDTAYGTLLQVEVTDRYGNAVADVPVTFSAPKSGPSGTFNALATVPTNTLGIATAPAFTANNIPGTFQVTARVLGLASTADFTLTNTHEKPDRHPRRVCPALGQLPPRELHEPSNFIACQ